MKRLVLAGLRFVLPPLVALFAPLFAVVARTGIGASICRRFGFQPIRVNYYQPIPEYETVPESWFTRDHDFPGFRFDEAVFRRELDRLSRFADECRWPQGQPAGGGYYTDNPGFGYSSAAVLHATIRARGTRKVVEIGGGFSSLISLEALRRNHLDGGYRFTCIEPYPSPMLEAAIREHAASAELIRRKAEDVPVATYLDLDENDILFIDSSHVSKLASDVNFLYLQVLPRLRPGAVVHVHDIFLPRDYPRGHFYGRQKLFWNEQYLLAALLSENPHWEILLPGHHVQTSLSDAFAAAFPHFDRQRHRPTGSFWMRRVPHAS